VNDTPRRLLFFAGAVPLLALLGGAVVELPRSGEGASRYGDLLIASAAPERHVTDVVSAVNFDYRACDTLGEELILFTSIMGVALLLRRAAEEQPGDDHDDHQPRRRAPPTSDAVRVLGLALVGFTVIFGLYIITHGQLTPGGGFQGGVIVATAWLVLYLAGDPATYCRLTPPPAVEAIEAAGAAAYPLLGAAGLLAGAAYLANVVPLGPMATVLSGGLIPLLSLATGFAVTGGIILLLTTFVEEALAERRRT
jgi:multicomponent Na+:H+ antiporter subunit B